VFQLRNLFVQSIYTIQQFQTYTFVKEVKHCLFRKHGRKEALNLFLYPKKKQMIYNLD